MRAYVIGNAALDETLSVESLPTEGASILARALSSDLGGKGANQAIVMARAGLTVTLAAPVGRDARGVEVRARLAAEGLADALIEVETPTDASLILASEAGENLVVTTHAAADALAPETALAALHGATAGDLAVVQGNLTEATTRALLTAARARGLRTAANPSPFRQYFAALWPLIDMAFLNEGEASDHGGADLLLAAGVAQVVITMGARGARLIEGTGERWLPVAAASVVDVTGAGDSFMATALASAHLRGVPLDVLAIQHGGRAAALTVGRAGTARAFPTREEMTSILVTL